MITSSTTPVAPEPASTQLVYSIAGCSEPSGKYVAENILVDSPMDQASRWSGAQQTPNTKQWILLRLESVSVVKSITFGKFHKQHPCNMKEFKLYIGLSEDHMIEVLHHGLKNDSTAETFPIKHLNASGVHVPSRYVKIMPLSSHQQSFHTSIWYIAMTGIADSSFVEQVRLDYDKCRETSVLRHILKHLRERRLLTPYASILSRSPRIRLEHPLITQLHHDLVLSRSSSFAVAESTLREASDAGLFDAYRRSRQPHAVWTQLHATDADGDVPSARGGHAMCIDPFSSSGMIYLFGGWNGHKSLDDFWVYDIAADRWKVLSHATSQEKNGPGARSCHKMVFDAKSGCIYLLGRLGDEDGINGSGRARDRDGADGTGQVARQGESGGERVGSGSGSSATTTAFCSEFYRYHTKGLDAGTWDLLSFDTASSGGPPLIFDHQMVMDSDTQMLYVFGGRVVDGDWNSTKYSGLYSYNVRTSKWKCLQPADSPSLNSQCYIPPRFGHSMILCPSTHSLIIFAGQRDDRYLSDMYTYDLRTNASREVFSNFSSVGVGGPDPCFTQRAVVDVELGEIYVFCGLTRSQKNGSIEGLRSDSPNWVYRYDNTGPGKWTQILPESGDEDEKCTAEPQSRYAHQVVYNPRTRTVYMHGGSAGLGLGTRGSGDRSSQREREENGDTDVGEGNGEGSAAGRADGEQEIARRLDDFWSMTLKRPDPAEIIRRGIYLIRQQQFREMCEEVPAIHALHFLQTEVSSVVDHSDPEETNVFRSLLSHLLAPTSSIRPVSDEHPLESPAPRTPDSDTLWTNVLDEDSMMGDDPDSSKSARNSASHPEDRTSTVDDEDPEERAIRRDATPLSAARFRQRTETFEALLEFVEAGEKEPTGSLLDMVDGELRL